MNKCETCANYEDDESCEKIRQGLRIEVEKTEAFGEYGRYWEEHEITGIFPYSDFSCYFWEEKKELK